MNHRLKIKALVKHYKKVLGCLCLALGITYFFCLPKQLFTPPYSTVIYGKNHELLGAKIATDGQWRFPPSDSIPFKIKTCMKLFEDEYFHYHFGFNPVSIGKALHSNATNNHIRGASTITQQVIRLSRKNKPRTYTEKLIELILATRLEFKYSKESILKFYANNAPFGGNVVGIDIASWRYFGVPPHKLSWAESATLAVLPNAPSLIFPGKNQIKLKQKRNRLLHKLYQKKIIDSITFNLSIAEDTPSKPHRLPLHSIHLLDHLKQKNIGANIISSIDYSLQKNVLEIVRNYHHQYKQNNIHNMAVLVLDIEQKKVLSYVGNTPTTLENHKFIDLIQSPRSTGSTLKPLLYAAMINEGVLLPKMLIKDTPTQIDDYTPKNYELNYHGAIAADEVISKSLNVPSVRMLYHYGFSKFYEELKMLQLQDINKRPDHYGLALILGGAESSLWNLSNTYMNLASTLNHFNENESTYFENEFIKASFLKEVPPINETKKYDKTIFNASSIYFMLEAMANLNRPEEEKSWEQFNSSQKIAWKTGTSYGNKDAWSIGLNKNYVVGVWVGNADGEGIPGLTGTQSASPIMFEIFNLLPKKSWFDKPLDDLKKINICSVSGHIAKDICPSEYIEVPLEETKTTVCPYHQKVFLDKQTHLQTHKNCIDEEQLYSKSWFVLPPSQAFYYRKLHPEYKVLPPYDSNCVDQYSKKLDFINIENKSRFVLTKDFNEQKNPLVIKASHQNENDEIFWYLDGIFIKTTKVFHELAILPKIGKHTITIEDHHGNRNSRMFIVE